GAAWQTAVFNLAASHSATTGNTAATWTSNATLPSWASQADSTYTVQATATDAVGNTFTGTAVSFTLDSTAPATASVTTPAGGSSFRAASVPASFSGSVADNSSGVGLNANSTTFTLDSTAPATASVTTPAGGSSFRAASVPASFSGSVADNSSGVGLNANSTTLTLQRSSDNNYWTGSAWQAAVFNMAASNSATSGGTAATWASSATLPTWA